MRELALSGSRCQLALAPGLLHRADSTMLRACSPEPGPRTAATSWRWPRPRPSGARLLGQATGTRAETLAKLLRELDTARGGSVGVDTLVLADEAAHGLRPPDLARLLVHALFGAGASVRLVGDDRQLAAIGATACCATSPRRHSSPR